MSVLLTYFTRHFMGIMKNEAWHPVYLVIKYMCAEF